MIAEVRGEGLLVGLRAVVPSAELVNELRAEKMLVVAAGDNVVRLLPPLIVSEDEMAEAVVRIDRACARIAGALVRPQTQGAARMSANGARHFLDLIDIPPQQLRGMIEASRAMKERRQHARKPLEGKTLAMIFDKPSTRTRVSFDVAMRQLGGEAIMLTGQEMQLGRGETIADTARVLSRYVDIIMIRTLEHATLTELARYASVPVINGLTRRSHPCQVLADVMTFEEHRGPIRGKTVAWTGDANNVLASWMHAAERFDFRLRVATPPELAPKKWLLDWVKSSGAAIHVGSDPEAAVKGSDCVVTDTWVSMGDKDGQRRHNLLRRYQVNGALMAQAKPDAVFMHCLPAHRGEEVTDEVIDGPQSVVFDEAENRLHAQKGILGLVFERRLMGQPAQCAFHRGGSRKERGQFCADRHYIWPSCPIPAWKFQRVRRRPPPPTTRSCPSRSKRSTCAVAWCASVPPSIRIPSRHNYPAPVAKLSGRGNRAHGAARLDAEVRRPLHPADPERRAGADAGHRLQHARQGAGLRPLRRRPCRRRHCVGRGRSRRLLGRGHLAMTIDQGADTRSLPGDRRARGQGPRTCGT